ncbi:MAG: Putative lipoprotein [Candidatus Tokpelaia hoelldobleri]|uniref:Chitooligosaccharide deacetylase n=1 Tax=Candidatus Tokpelaia hoelldobleri TaxID=1902579 RepID=A0A1U9JT98_9HYPH|nr:MAG: Putative lipoprotein [Candidatus Tokpelaia hoelldoblerii]
MLKPAAVLLLSLCFSAPVLAVNTLAPRLEVQRGQGTPQVALTLDLCMGQTDRRIFDLLIAEKIPATLFVTRRWLVTNSTAVAQIRAHPELFEIGNHGAEHVPALDHAGKVYGLKTAGTLYNICREAEGGAAAIREAGLARHYMGWYRGAAALYSPHAIAMLEGQGLRIAGFSLNADMGASLPAAVVARRIGMAHNGDVVIAHMNQPGRPSGAGVVSGISALKQKGFRFIRLSDGAAPVRPATRLPRSCAEFLKEQPRL